MTKARGYYTDVKVTKVALLFGILVLSACSFFGRAATPTPATSQATATSTPEPPLLILLAPQGSDAELASSAAELAGTFAGSHDMQFQQVDRLSTSELPSNLAMLVILAPDPGAADLASAASSARVITVGFSVDGVNVQTVLPNQVSPGQVAFIAGYTAELLADDWRAGMMYTAVSRDLVDAFISGGRYYCGSCIPGGPPLSDYPQAVQAADPSQWQAAADQLIAQSVKVVYLAPELEGSGVEQYLAAYGILLIGAGNPPQGQEANWVAGISSDAVSEVRQELPLALAGEPLEQGNSLKFVDPNPSYLSEARLAFIQIIINDLLNGYLSISGND